MIVASFIAGALLMLLGVWSTVGFADVEHVPVRIFEANHLDNGAIELLVGSCNGAPTATIDSDSDPPQVEVRAFRFKSDRDSCQDILEVFLTRPNGDVPSELLDAHTGEVVEIGSTN
ncbi:MAG: hypothetical protein ACI81L_002909 [Verrucomicrobiales bacterium]|jgi:hypothetical protein